MDDITERFYFKNHSDALKKQHQLESINAEYLPAEFSDLDEREIIELQVIAIDSNKKQCEIVYR